MDNVRTSRFPLVRIERHRLGPRLHVLGRRVHECHVGLAVGLAAAALAIAHVSVLAAGALGALAVWMVAKDWRDLRPSTRDTAAWSLGIHRVPSAPPAPPVRDRVPLVAAVVTAVVGLINIGSAMTAALPGRLRDLLAVAPAGEVRFVHALALPLGLALVAAAWPLARRRSRALKLTVAGLLALGVVDLLKGIDVEEAVISWTLAAGLWRARAAFWVRHERQTLIGALRRTAAILGGATLAAWAAVAVAAPHGLPPIDGAATLGAALSLLALGGPAFSAPFVWLPLALGIVGVATVAIVVAGLLAPLQPVVAALPGERRRAAGLVRRHGADTLSAFKLRGDLARRFSADGRAMAGFRVEAGTMLLSGDPVGPGDALPALLDDVVAHARSHGLALGVVGASEEFAALGRAAGLRRVYLGDEAIVPTGTMALAGGANKSLRKAVNRIARHGFTAEARSAGELDAATIAELEAVSERWRDGAPERGFSMAHDALVDELLPDALVVLARDEHGRVRGFLHFVPVFGRPAASLAFMRRDRDTPNGLTDFLVVEAARLLGERGLEEFSLNFAAWGRWLREPANAVERVAAGLLRVGDRWFQVERLLHFNAKFSPRWQPRYLLFGGVGQLPRVALAALWVEGQLPRPRLLRPRGLPALAPSAG